MRADWIISGCGHVAIFVAGFITLANSSPNADMPNPVPVSVVTDADISRAALGQKNAPNQNKPPLADKIDIPKQVEQIAPKAAPKPEIKTDSGPPKPQQKPPEDKPDPKAAQKPDKKPPDFKPDKIADLLKKDEKQKPREEKDSRQAPTYDANEIAQVLDHRDPRRDLAAAGEVNPQASLGAPNALPNAQVSQSELDALRQRLSECWSPPPGVDSNTDVYVQLHVLFRQDGSLAQPPELLKGTISPLGPAFAESAKRALLQCQPFTMLRPEHYAQWKEIYMNFTPHDLAN